MTPYIMSLKLTKAVTCKNQNVEISSTPAEEISPDSFSPLLLDQKKIRLCITAAHALAYPLISPPPSQPTGTSPTPWTPLLQQQLARTIHFSELQVMSKKFQVFPEFWEIPFIFISSWAFYLKTTVYINRNKHIKAMASEVLPQCGHCLSGETTTQAACSPTLPYPPPS